MAFSGNKKALQKKGGEIIKVYERQEVFKHWLHKNYVRSNNAVLANHGISFVSLQAFRYCLIGSLIFVFAFGVRSALQADWLLVAAAWFGFNSFYEAYTWVRDNSDPKRIKKIDDDIKEAFYASLPSTAPESKNPIEEESPSLSP